jgi:hypothetical protein
VKTAVVREKKKKGINREATGENASGLFIE